MKRATPLTARGEGGGEGGEGKRNEEAEILWILGR